MAEVKFIGITGGVGCGKSKVLKYIRENYPAEIIISDDVANRLKERGNKCYDSIVALLSEDVLLKDGEIDRRRMAEKIFSDDELLRAVNDIIHPAVTDEILKQYESAKKEGKIRFFFVEAALLIETGFKDIVDELWYIYADIGVRRRRLKETRGYTDLKIDSIMASQLSDEEYRKHCDFVIDNSGSLDDTYRQIDKKLEAF